MDEIELQSLYRHIGSRVKLRRLQLSLSCEEVAASLKISRKLLERIEKGQSRIDAYTLMTYARHVKVPVIWFFTDVHIGDGPGKPMHSAGKVIELAFFRDMTHHYSSMKTRKAA